MAKATKPTKKAKAKEAAPAAASAPEPAKQAPAAEEQVLVKVGPNSPAGRIMLGRTIYDGITPQWMSRANFERLKAKYDLREVKAE